MNERYSLNTTEIFSSGRLLFLSFSLLLVLAACKKSEVTPPPPPPAQQHSHRADIQKYFEAQGVRFPDQWYEQAALEAERNEASYQGKYEIACLNSKGTRTSFDESSVPVGQLLTVATGDPAIKDRSMAALITHWARYFESDFRYQCELKGLPGPQMCSPVTYYYDYKKWLCDKEKNETAPPPNYISTFLYFPSHPTFEDPDAKMTTKDIYDLFERVRNIPDQEQRLMELHKLGSWLKEDRSVTEIAGVKVPKLMNVAFTGMGNLWAPLLMFGPPGRNDETVCKGKIREPQVAVGITVQLRRLMETNPNFSALYDAGFSFDASPEAYKNFLDSYPFATMWEDICFTDDTLALTAARKANPNATLMCEKDSSRPKGHMLRSITVNSIVSSTFDRETGIPVLGQEGAQLPQRPPSGACMEEASYFLHPSMLHAWNGWATADWHSEDPSKPGNQGMSGLYEDFRNICNAWNENYPDYEERYGQKALLPFCNLPPPLAHMEIWDSHVNIPHGDVESVQNRLNQLMTNPQSKADWLALGYKVPDNWPCTKEKPCDANPCPTLHCTKDNLGIRDVGGCQQGDANCVASLASVFQAPYVAPYTRLSSSLSSLHKDSGKKVEEMFNDPLTETVKDTVQCRAGINTVVITDKSCIFPDDTIAPNSFYNESTQGGEVFAPFWNYLWTYGSMYPLHDTTHNRHLPRYWSMNGDSGADGAGLLSFRSWENNSWCLENPASFPDSSTYNANWFVSDTYGYFSQVAEAHVNPSDLKSPLDLSKIIRAGRGDGLYLLQYYPQRFLFWKQTAGTNQYDETFGSTLPNPSYIRKCLPAKAD